MQRLLKRWLAPVLPHWLRQRIKAHAAAGLNDGPVKEITLEETETFIRCTIDHSWSFLAPKECQYDLELHQSTQEGRAELSGIATVALQGGVMFDIGAHMGIMSAIFCAAKPTNKVYSFEPSPITQKRLEVIRDLNQIQDRMFIQPTAIGQDRAKLEMTIDPLGGYVQIQKFEHAGWGETKQIQVDVESIPQAAERLGVIPDFIKIDIESYEYEALLGAKTFLIEHQPVLLFELHSNYLEQRGLKPGQVIDLLLECGYDFTTYTGQPLTARFVADSPLSNLRFLATPKNGAASRTAEAVLQV